MSAQLVGMKAKILGFLGAGISPERVAGAVGCEPSYISQLLADEEFAREVSERRLLALGEASARDDRLNAIEDKIITRTEELINSPLAFKSPMEAVKALTMVNSLKRRGSEGAMQTTQHSVVISLTLPQVTASKFVVDINNQVIQAGDQSLITMPSGSMQSMASEEQAVQQAAQIEQHSIPNKESRNVSVKRDGIRLEDLA